MKKLMIFSLLFISTVILHGMDQNILQNKDIIKEITSALYVENLFIIDKSGIKKYNFHEEGIIRSFGKDIQALTCTNKIFRDFYSNEAIIKKLTPIIASHLKLSHTSVLYHLNPKGGIFNDMHKRIENLFTIAANPDAQFTKDDLQDSWYLNATSMRDTDWINRISPKPIKESSYPKFRNLVEVRKPYTLLSTAYERQQLEKIKILVNNGIDVKNTTNNELLEDIAKKRSTNKTNYKKRKFFYLTVAKLLLENGAYPDFSYSTEYPTPLLIAVHNDDQEYAQLLLEYGANPEHGTYATKRQTQYPFFYDPDKILKNAFDLEPTGWLKEMVNTIEILKKEDK